MVFYLPVSRGEGKLFASRKFKLGGKSFWVVFKQDEWITTYRLLILQVKNVFNPGACLKSDTPLKNQTPSRLPGKTICKANNLWSSIYR